MTKMIDLDNEIFFFFFDSNAMELVVVVSVLSGFGTNSKLLRPLGVYIFFCDFFVFLFCFNILVRVNQSA